MNSNDIQFAENREQAGRWRRRIERLGRWGWPLMFAAILGLWLFTRLGGVKQKETAMPAKVTDAAERELYLTAAGAYTAADIAANGGQTASQKYRTFRAEHDFNPRPGDVLCPITRTKANPACTWIVAGKTYQFCCPPCIDEFVALAKKEPQTILPPEAYRKQAE